MATTINSVDLCVDLAASILRGPEKGRPEWASDETAIRQGVESYRKFFGLMSAYPEESLVPTEIQDYVWHQHMLNPKAYYQSCIASVGEIIDHDGGFGYGPGEAEALSAGFARTKQLWKEYFGESHPADESVANGASCKSWCKGTTCRNG